MISAFVDRRDERLDVAQVGLAGRHLPPALLARLAAELLLQLRRGGVVEAPFDELEVAGALDEHLSPNRHVGVYAMFDLMKQKVADLQEVCAA